MISECVAAMNSIPPGEVMGQVHMADGSDKTQATKRIDAWKGYPVDKFQGYNHVPNIVLSVYRSSASHLMTSPRDGASQLLNASPAERFNESISQKQREELLYRLSRVSMIIATSSTMLSKTRTEILTSDIRRIIRVLRSWGYKRSFPVPGQNGYRLPA